MRLSRGRFHDTSPLGFVGARLSVSRRSKAKCDKPFIKTFVPVITDFT
jgi:hypothetical protein